MRANGPGGDIAVMTFSVKPVIDLAPDPSNDDAVGGDPLIGSPAADKIRDACVNFFGRGTTNISNAWHLAEVKVASLDAEGRYTIQPRIYTVDVAGAYPNNPMPPQVALRVTLDTDGALGKVKGGFYIPGVPRTANDNDPARVTDAYADQVESSVKDLYDELHAAPSVGLVEWRMVVASGGRYGVGGVVVAPPGLHDVKRISVGRRLDVQRRRANRISEARNAPVAI